MHDEEIFELMHSASKLSEAEISALEDLLAKNSEDVSVRIRLLGYYHRKHFSEEAAKFQLAQHIEWFIDNHPESEIFQNIGGIFRSTFGRAAYLNFKKKWISKISTENVNLQILNNVADFFIHEEKIFSEQCLQRAKQADPTNKRWSRELSKLYSLWGTGYEELALFECRKTLELANKRDKFYEFSKYPEFAYKAGLYDDAVQAAKKLIKMSHRRKDHWNYGNAINDAYTIRGLVALRENNLREAKRCLLKSTQNAGSPQTQSFGPHKQLVAELLDCGETETALQYFELCGVFWTSGKKRLESWREKIRNGDNPLEYLLRKNRVFFDQTAKPRSLYKANRFGEAESASKILLQLSHDHKTDPRNYGYAVHVANVVLGQIALRSDNLKLAKEHHLSSFKIPHSERLVHHGPDLSLCADLAKLGEKDLILAFFQNMERYWSTHVPEPALGDFISAAKRNELHPDLLW